ncbi:hypothetical protein ABTI24_18880, partial [Acinetobacter baumannii]
LDLGISAAFGIAVNIVGRVSETSAIESFGRQPKKPKARPGVGRIRRSRNLPYRHHARPRRVTLR